jgi:hypothetical protein
MVIVSFENRERLNPGRNQARIARVFAPEQAYTYKCMIPGYLRSLFWGIDLDAFDPQAYPDYTIFRVLEYGDEEAVMWLRKTFADSEIRRVLSTEHRLSPKSANFWSLVYGIPSAEIAALNGRLSRVFPSAPSS